MRCFIILSKSAHLMRSLLLIISFLLLYSCKNNSEEWEINYYESSDSHYTYFMIPDSDKGNFELYALPKDLDNELSSGDYSVGLCSNYYQINKSEYSFIRGLNNETQRVGSSGKIAFNSKKKITVKNSSGEKTVFNLVDRVKFDKDFCYQIPSSQKWITGIWEDEAAPKLAFFPNGMYKREDYEVGEEGLYSLDQKYLYIIHGQGEYERYYFKENEYFSNYEIQSHRIGNDVVYSHGGWTFYKISNIAESFEDFRFNDGQDHSQD